MRTDAPGAASQDPETHAAGPDAVLLANLGSPRAPTRSAVAAFLAESAGSGAFRAFLEVAADNEAAVALYRQAGFAEAGRRTGYYRRPDGTRIDACLLARDLP